MALHITHDMVRQNGGQYVTERYVWQLDGGKLTKTPRTDGDGLTVTEVKSDAESVRRSNDFQKENYDRVHLTLEKGEKARLYVVCGGKGNLNKWIKAAMSNYEPGPVKDNRCPVCGKSLTVEKYCPDCGKRLKR